MHLHSTVNIKFIHLKSIIISVDYLNGQHFVALTRIWNIFYAVYNLVNIQISCESDDLYWIFCSLLENEWNEYSLSCYKKLNNWYTFVHKSNIHD